MTTEAAKAPAAPPKEEELTLELVDEQQILAELQGMHFENDKFVFPVHDGFALTYKAIKLACRMFEERGEALEVVGDVVTKYDEKDPDFIIAHVKVQRVKINAKGLRIPMGSEVGVKRKWIKERLRSGEIRADASFYEKACAQAQRNAKQALLPPDFLLEFKDIIMKKGGAKGVPARPSAPAKPQGAAKPPQGAPAKPASAPAGAPPPASQAPAAGAPAAPPPGAAPGAPAPDAQKRKLTMQQQFWVFLKQAIPQAKTEGQQRNVLKKLTGKLHVKELDEAVIKVLGPAIRKVVEGEAALKELEPQAGGPKVLAIYHVTTSSFLWPQGFKAKDAPPAAGAAAPAPAAPASPAAPAPEPDPEAAPPTNEEPMF